MDVICKNCLTPLESEEKSITPGRNDPVILTDLSLFCVDSAAVWQSSMDVADNESHIAYFLGFLIDSVPERLLKSVLVVLKKDLEEGADLDEDRYLKMITGGD